MRVVYIAGKFRGPTAWHIERNIRRAEEAGMRVAEMGAAPLIPHANTRFFHGTLTDEFWLKATMALLLKCDAVYAIDGWTDSEGAKAEVREADDRGIPVFDSAWSLKDWLASLPKPGDPTP